MMEIRVGRVGGEGHYVGRARKAAKAPFNSCLGNPFKPRDHTVDAHKDVCAKYREWLWWKICKKDARVLAELELIRQEAKRPEGVTLLCYCTPLPCHAEVIKNAVMWLDSR